ncbi:hypothetical protein QBC46DRAFT_341005 [Diplogelasinospora grovesii]|uniref:Uncharacterized protein n=1 Tax=Diplogelasinospora grovesii TaxID=303347 RepID=A0AAN6S5R9_9PEZI|nr:hypothetical protein QBC46DRAFT_341005 [Diplogelasinospora grovesii]
MFFQQWIGFNAVMCLASGRAQRRNTFKDVTEMKYDNDIVRRGFATLYGIFSGALPAIATALAAQACPRIKKVGAYTRANFSRRIRNSCLR